ncbi:hypothetical protein K4F52_004043 [Lecanicillium sp. MT-2017a]|nr:hypothetical protein K4F52_004043 [Lecanicillium sp. MT-2017a]
MPADISDTRGQLLRRFKILRRDGLQYQRHLLALVAALHLALGVGRFIFDVFWNKSGYVPPELKLLDLLSVVLTVVARLVWAEQLRLQHRFLCFIRPSRAYRWAMYGVAAATTVPAFALHFPIIRLSAGKGRVIDNVLQTQLQLATWVATCGYYFYIVRKYMLGFEDGTYEPVAASSVGEHGSLLVDAVEESPEALTPLSHSGGLESPLGRLELAYSLQRAADSQEGSRRTRASSRLAQTTEQNTTSAATTAHNEPTILGGTLEGQIYARYSILCPVGGLLLVAYSRRKRMKQTRFIRKSVGLPPAWSKSQTASGQVTYVNSDFESTTEWDPRLRVYPLEASTGRVNRIQSLYIKAYNANRAPCDDYWGHCGRQWTGSPRLGPLLGSLAWTVLGTATALLGFLCSVMHPDSKILEEHLALPDLTVGELIAVLKTIRANLTVTAASVPLALVAAICALWNVATLPLLWYHRNNFDSKLEKDSSATLETEAVVENHSESQTSR